MSEQPWWSQAGCRGEPLGLFFGEDGETDTLKAGREAKARELCWVCPVRDVCLVQAVQHDDVGVRGGLTYEERRNVRRRWMRRGYLVPGPDGYRMGAADPLVVCDHCLRSGAPGGQGPRGMRLVAACRARWVRAGRPDQVPDTEPVSRTA